MNKNMEKEKSRIFCKHDLQHSLDVARIAYILNLEADLKIEKEIIYAAALLHDITKWKQYEDGTPHHESVLVPAEKILADCGFDKIEIQLILEAIHKHRKCQSNEKTFSKILYDADKKSRRCFECEATQKCNWSDSKKNSTIIY